jgi:hypothetical protein
MALSYVVSEMKATHTNYHSMHRCMMCGSDDNIVNPLEYEQGHMSEALCTCPHCDYRQYWSYGFFDEPAYAPNDFQMRFV